MKCAPGTCGRLRSSTGPARRSAGRATYKRSCARSPTGRAARRESGLASAMSIMPRMPFIGVRSSCDMLARNSLFASLAAMASCIATCSSPVRCRMRSSSVVWYSSNSFFEASSAATIWLKLSPSISISSPVRLTSMGSRLAFHHRPDAFLQQPQRARQQAGGHARDGGRRAKDDDHHHQAPAEVEGLAVEVVDEQDNDDPKNECGGEDKELRRERLNSFRS